METHTFTKSKISSVFLWVLSFLCLTFIEIILLAAIATIPRAAIYKSTKESADYFMEKDVFYHANSADSASYIDHYADSILLNILYNYDSSKPISSALKASYYFSDIQNENDNLLTSVTTNPETTYDYFRYWHGSAILVRPLLTFMNIKQIYILYAIILILLFITLIIMLCRNNHIACAVSFIISLITVSPWYIPMSLEYIWCFLIMLISSICLIKRYNRKHCVSALYFLIIGNITAYFDFLTTETLTLLVPLSLLLVIMHKNNQLTNIKAGFKLFIYNSIGWGIGYISSWIAKWTITSIVLHKNIFKEALSSASSRVYESAGSLKGIPLAINALLRNISCILPFNFIKEKGYMYAIGLFVVIVAVYYLYRKIDKKNFMPKLFMIIYCIPYIRYIILANHSFIHYFFTYRAQFASIFCLCMIFYYGTDRKLLSKSLRFISGSHNPSR